MPVLRRPHRVSPLLESVEAATPKPYRVLFIVDPDDEEERRAIEAAGAESLVVAEGYAGKINAGVRATGEPLLFLGADDLHFHPGWLERASARLRGAVQVVGVNDLCSRRVRLGHHATHFLMRREYAERPTIDGREGPLCTVYEHNFVDDELIGTARRRGALAIASDAIVEHLHPNAGKAPNDATYRRGEASFRRDRMRFRRRRHLWS